MLLEAVRNHRPPKILVSIALLGTALAVTVTFAIDSLEPRYSAALFASLALMSAAMLVSRRAQDFALYLLAFNLPFTSIEKSLFLTTQTTYVTPGVAIGLFEILLVSLYVLWFVRIFVMRTESIPRPTVIDWWVLAFIAAHVLSLYNSISPVLTVFEIIRLMKYAAAFFYIEHNLERRQLKVIVAAVLLAMTFQAAVGVVQVRTGKLLGIGRTKGASELEYEQYTVKNFESYYRAEGTTFDSHAYGLYFAMSLPLAMALLLTPRMKRGNRIAIAAAFAMGTMGLVISFARGSWAAFAAAALIILICQVKWKRWRVLAVSGVLFLVISLPALIPFARAVRQRLFEAPPELVTGRLETLQIAFNLWKENLWTGSGANTYMRLLELKFSVFAGDPYFIPPHNMLVYILSELGVIGLVVFLGFSVACWRMTWQVVKLRSDEIGAVAAAVCAAFTALQVEGVFDPIYVTNVSYFLLWFLLGIGAAMWRMTYRDAAAEVSASTPTVAATAS
jgi:hypothetical protein